tara:strand:+ start:419 stop:847 length:429 start_codon:yes stop_codon:yes gene_type:complete
MIDGIILTENKIINHPDGDILQIIKKSSSGFCGFGEVYVSSINKNRIKGWKRHNDITINLTVVKGNIKFAIYDDRVDSKTYKEINSFILGPYSQYSRLTIISGLWVAFKGLDDNNLLINVIPKEHDKNEADNMPLDFISFPI